MEEENSQEWKELRARVDTLSNSIFLLAGGAITLSASALINAKASKLNSLIAAVKDDAAISWYLLLISILLFVLLKMHLVLQAYARLNSLNWYSSVAATNKIGWSIGALGLICFSVGLVLLIHLASQVLNA